MVRRKKVTFYPDASRVIALVKGIVLYLESEGADMN